MADHLVAVTAVGNDRPGIVAGVTGVLFELGCNLEDATSTILRGHFAMMLVVRLPEAQDAASIEEHLAATAAELGLVVTVRDVEPTAPQAVSPTHIIAVYGTDRPGLVYRVADVLARSGANITDLTSRVTGTDDHPVYAVVMEAQVRDIESAEAGLSDLKRELGIDVTVRPLATDVF
jgi:glycine cleavage system transcriptional repressor